MIANQHALPNSPRGRARNSVRLKTIALPAEHGGWGIVLEPIALGLMLAPSIAGAYLALSALAFFLARQPLMLVMLSRDRESPRAFLGRRFSALYVTIGVAAFTAAIIFSEHSFILPLAIAAPLAGVQLFFDWSGRKRVLTAEVAGAVAISSLAAALALAGGWPKAASFALSAIMIARTVPTIFYVRECLARLHRRAASPLPIWTAHVGAIILVAVLMRAGLSPRLAVAAMIVLTVRALIGFWKVGVTAKQLGFSEIGFGSMTVLAVVCGTRLGW